MYLSYLIIALIILTLLACQYYNHVKHLKKDLLAANDKLLKTIEELNTVKTKAHQSDLNHTALQVKLEILEAQFTKTQKDSHALEQQNVELQKILESFKAQNNILLHSNEKLEQEKKQIKIETRESYDTLQSFLSEKFKSMAQNVLQEKNEDFKKQSKGQIEGLLLPLKIRIEDFHKQIQESDKERYNLKLQLKEINHISINLIEQTKSLSDALKGNNKIQGTWGEIVLEKVLELSGLQRNTQFICQATMLGSAHNTLKPDAIIYLPDNKQVVVDAKTSFKSYELYCNAEDNKAREEFLRMFLQSLKKHIKELSMREYQKIGNLNTVDFVIMFIPIESAFLLGYQEVYQFAWEHNVMIASPTTIIPILRMINFIWKEKNQKENHKRIAHSAGVIHDKICSILTDLKKIKLQINNLNTKSNEIWDDVYNKKIHGRGGIVSNLNELAKMGVIAKKSMIDDDSLI